jgi:hypothetical protein
VLDLLERDQPTLLFATQTRKKLLGSAEFELTLLDLLRKTHLFIMLLLQVFNQLLVLPLDFFQVVLLQLELAHLRPVPVLRIRKLDTLWLDETMNRVILLHLDDPVA